MTVLSSLDRSGAADPAVPDTAFFAPPHGHVPSWYAATANWVDHFPTLQGDITCDVVVIGGGYTGLSCALALRERGYDVVLLEQHRIGWGASGRNGGQIVTGYNQSLSDIATMVGQDGAARLWQMAEEAKGLLADRVARYGIDCDLHWGYVFAGTKDRHRAELTAWLDEVQGRYGYAPARYSSVQGGPRLLDADGVRQVVDSPRYACGLYDPGSGHLHPLNYALGLARAAHEAGVRIFTGSAVQVVEPGTPVRARTTGGRVTARFAALAGNAYLPGLTPEVERRVRPRIMPVGTYILATEPLGDLADRILPGGDAVCDINFVLNYYRLSRDRRMLFGGGVSYTGREMPGTAERLRRTMVHYLPHLAGCRVEYFWGGYVAITRNRLPHFGRIAPNVLFAQGFSGQGVALTGLAGQVMAEAIAGQAERFDLFSRLPHAPFPGGRSLRTPLLVLATTWFKLRDLL